MDINLAPEADPTAALRAAQTQFSLDAINRFIEMATELAALIVQDAKQPAPEQPAAKPAPKPHHAADFDRLFRGVRRAVLVSQKLLAPPKPERASPEQAARARQPPKAPPAEPQPRKHTSGGGKYPYPYFGLRDPEDAPDRPDRLDGDDPPAPRRPPTEAEEILAISRQFNIMAAPGTKPLLDRPLKEVKILSYRVGEAISSALLPLGLLNAHGTFPDLPPDHDDTS